MSYKLDFENSTGWNAIDTNRKLTLPGGEIFINFLKTQKVNTIIRYYASSFRDKTISQEEVKLIVSSGFAILPVYQDTNRLPEHFSFEKGKAAAKNALQFVNAVDQPDNSTIMFAVDSDLSASVIQNNVAEYFKGLKDELLSQGRTFRIGVYGSGLACRTLMDKGLVEVPWLSMSRGFTGTQDFFYSNDWMLRQIPPDTKHASGFSYDRNIMPISPNEIGAFTYNATGEGVIVTSSDLEITPPIYPGYAITESPTTYSLNVKLIQKQLDKLGHGPLKDDGKFGNNTSKAVRDFQTKNKDLNGNPLDVDGKVGKLTWGVLFSEWSAD